MEGEEVEKFQNKKADEGWVDGWIYSTDISLLNMYQAISKSQRYN